MQPLEQHHLPARVGAVQPHHAVAGPGLQAEVLVLRLVVGPGGLEHGGPAARRTHRHDQRAVPVHRRAVEGELPLLGHVADQPRERGEPGRPGLPALGEREQARRQVEREQAHPATGGAAGTYFFPLLSPVSPVESAAMKASCGTSTRPTIFIRFLPSFCFSSSLRFRVMSPP